MLEQRRIVTYRNSFPPLGVLRDQQMNAFEQGLQTGNEVAVATLA